MEYDGMDGLEALQDSLFDLLSRFDALCGEAGCEYSLMCGTLLGAVRHGGFIPWDDDADVVMFRSEFEKLRAFFDAANDTCGVYLDEEDTWVPRIKKSGADKAFLDIFILDKSAPKESAHRLDLFKLKLLQGMMKKDIEYGRYSFVYKCCVFGSHIIGKLFSFKTKYKWYHKLAAKYNNDPSAREYYIADGAFKVIPLIWDHDEFDELLRTKFRDAELLIPKKYDSVLTKLYGPDYMQPPPVGERKPKHASN